MGALVLATFLVLLAQSNLADPVRSPAPPDPATVERPCGHRDDKGYRDCSQDEQGELPDRFKSRILNQPDVLHNPVLPTRSKLP